MWVAVVVMSNDYHLAVETPEPNLSEGMKWLQGTWATRFNRFRGESGRPFQGRYKALHVEPGHALGQVAHYIHLNPVRAKVVSAARLLDHRWGSLPLLAGKGRPASLEGATVLAEAGGLADTPGGWRRYLAYLEVLAEEEAKLRDKKFGRLSRGWVVGSADFKSALRKDLTARSSRLERLELAGADRAGQRELRAELWEETLQAGAKSLGLALGKLPAQRSAAEKVLLAALMKTATSVSNGWLAERLAMGKTASVSQNVRRFRLAGGPARRDFKRALSRVTT